MNQERYLNADPEILDQLLTSFYRCPAQGVQLWLKAYPLTEPGYFRFGDHAICYGRSGLGKPWASPTAGLVDAQRETKVGAGYACLPFDPMEVLDNLRFEHYMRPVRPMDTFTNQFLRKVYYVIRPLLGGSFRRHLQRTILTERGRPEFPSWPVDFTVERILERLLALVLRAGGVGKVPFI